MPLQKKTHHVGEYTLPETNIAPENGWLEYYFPIREAYFQGLIMLVSGRVHVYIHVLFFSNHLIEGNPRQGFNKYKTAGPLVCFVGALVSLGSLSIGIQKDSRWRDFLG